MILPETDGGVAAALAENVRQAIAALDIVDGGNSLPRVTASIGGAIIPGSVENFDELIESADRALYLAKSYGRNQVVIAAVASALDGEV